MSEIDEITIDITDNTLMDQNNEPEIKKSKKKK